MKSSPNTLKTPSGIIVAAQVFYSKVARIQEASGTQLSLNVANKSLIDLVDKLKKETLPKLNGGIKGIKDRFAKIGIKLNELNKKTMYKGSLKIAKNKGEDIPFMTICLLI